MLILSTFVVGMISCERDFPDDIPEWLKKDIQKREHQELPLSCDICEEIHELQDTVTKEYYYLFICNYPTYCPSGDLYDSEGNFACDYHISYGCSEVQAGPPLEFGTLIWRQYGEYK